MSEAAGVTIKSLEKIYPGAEHRALEDVSLEIEPGSFFSVLGPSGCGKTTLLRILAGFERPTAGSVAIGGRDVTHVPPRERDIAMVFQDYALYPHMTVRQNITFNLVNRRVAAAEIELRLGETVAMLDIERHLAKYPAHLSGGERQRVALGRALIRKPKVFLMDEPLSNLDLKLREAMRLELGRLHQRLGITVVYVTHDQAEAMTLSTSLAIIDNGRLQQIDGPEAVYRSPANTFVAKFIGSPSMNLFHATHENGRILIGGRDHAVLPFRPQMALKQGQKLLIGARPHELAFKKSGKEPLPVRINFTERLGRHDVVVCTVEDPLGDTVEGGIVQVETDPGERFLPDQRLALTFSSDTLVAFDEAGNALGRLTT